MNNSSKFDLLKLLIYFYKEGYEAKDLDLKMINRLLKSSYDNNSVKELVQFKEENGILIKI